MRQENGIRATCSPNRPRAFTLIELLVVVAIVAVLIGVILPAIQKVREAVARTHCAHNLKQIGLALQNFHGTANSFPSGYVSNYDSDGNDTGPGWGWAAFILPHLEQRNLYEAIEFDQNIEAPANNGARVQLIKSYVCPSDDVPMTWTATEYDALANPLGSICDVASASYIGVFGIGEPGVDGEGIFFRNSTIRIADITDGTGQTMMVGERSSRWGQAAWVGSVTNASMVAPPGSPALVGVWNGTGFVLGHTFEGTGGPGSPGTEVNGFASQHMQGSNFLFADGHVAFVQASMDHQVFKAMSTRAGGELVGGDF